MRIRLLVVALLAAVLLAAVPTAVAQPAPRATAAQQAANAKLGLQLVTRFWELLKAKDQDGLRAFLSPAFQVQRADGTGANRNQYIPTIGKTVIVDDYELADMKVTRSGPLLVARFVATSKQIINGSLYSKAPQPRIMTFFFNGTGWKATSNANFNAPAS